LYSIFDINQDSKIQNTKYKILNTKNDFGKEKIAYLSIKPKHKNSYQAYIPIMTGCNNFCSYCVVPYARGREISRPAGEIIREVKNLIKKGYKEIVLLGQNVNSYKSEIQKSEFKINSKFINFSNLLREINLIPGNFWISFASSHPKDFSNELIETIAQCKKVCEWVHLPIQAGNDKILEKMNRRYSQTYYLNLLKKMRAAFKKYKPDILYSLSSDIIVGFPGETKKQFLDSAKVMEKAKFDMVYFSQFSPRPGTLAYKLKDSVSKKEKSRREKYLNEILKKTSSENNQKYLGRTLEVLIDKKELPKAKPLDPKGLALGENTYFGRTRTMKNVKIISTKKNLVGKIVKVEIIQTNIWNLEGKL
jgi:tRNA-2-methylthio-N6-dimethylallyladenosine synthase